MKSVAIVACDHISSVSCPSITGARSALTASRDLDCEKAQMQSSTKGIATSFLSSNQVLIRTNIEQFRVGEHRKSCNLKLGFSYINSFFFLIWKPAGGVS
jgi:hypothetical protein